MLDRRAFLATLSGGLLAAPLAVEAQQPGTLSRIGFVEAGAPSANQHFLDAFKRGLRDLGYVEGQNIAIEERWAEGRSDRFPALLAELIQLRVDLIVQASTPGALAAKTATTTIPIVFVGAADPVGNGIVASLGRPGANLTGFSQGDDIGLGGKRLAFLKEAVPKLAQVAVLWNPTARGLETRVKEMHGPATSLKVKLQAFEVRTVSELDGVFAAITRARVDGLAVLTDPLTLRHRIPIVNLAAKTRLPAVYGFGEFARVGGLMVYGASIPDLFKRAALYVDRILKGAKPADLPVEEPTKLDLVINLKTATALGLTIPPSLLQRADQVIE